MIKSNLSGVWVNYLFYSAFFSSSSSFSSLAWTVVEVTNQVLQTLFPHSWANRPLSSRSSCSTSSLFSLVRISFPSHCLLRKSYCPRGLPHHLQCFDFGPQFHIWVAFVFVTWIIYWPPSQWFWLQLGYRSKTTDYRDLLLQSFVYKELFLSRVTTYSSKFLLDRAWNGIFRLGHALGAKGLFRLGSLTLHFSWRTSLIWSQKEQISLGTYVSTQLW